MQLNSGGACSWSSIWISAHIPIKATSPRQPGKTGIKKKRSHVRYGARLLKHQEMKKKITIEVSEALHKKFSAKVKKRKTNKTAAITKLIRGY